MGFRRFENRFRPNFSSLLIRVIAPKKERNIKIQADLPKMRTQPGIVIFDREVLGFDTEGEPAQSNPLFKDFLSFVSQVYKDKLKENIETQKFRDRWPPLSEKYLKRKKRARQDLRMWIRTGQLIDSIRVFFHPTVGDFEVGLSPRDTFNEVEMIKDTRGNIIDHRVTSRKTPIPKLLVARVLEFGSLSRNIPPRPLFRPTLTNIQKNIRKHFQEFASLNNLELV